MCSGACVDLTELLPSHSYRPSPQDIEYIESVKAQPLEFQVAVSEDAAAWKRAHDILIKLGPDIGGRRALLISTATILEMSPPKRDDGSVGKCKDGEGFAYRIVRAPHDGAVDYSVSYCAWTSSIGIHDDSAVGEFSYDSKGYARLIAYYIVSGVKRLEAIWHD